MFRPFALLLLLSGPALGAPLDAHEADLRDALRAAQAEAAACRAAAQDYDRYAAVFAAWGLDSPWAARAAEQWACVDDAAALAAAAERGLTFVAQTRALGDAAPGGPCVSLAASPSAGAEDPAVSASASAAAGGLDLSASASAHADVAQAAAALSILVNLSESLSAGAAASWTAALSQAASEAAADLNAACSQAAALADPSFSASAAVGQGPSADELLSRVLQALSQYVPRVYDDVDRLLDLPTA